MVQISLHILTLTLLFLLACSSWAETNDATRVPHVDVDLKFVSSLKAIFASHAPPSREATDPATTDDVGSGARDNVQRIISDPETNRESSIIFPPKWRLLGECPCTFEGNCRLACCKSFKALTRIKVELEEIGRSLETVPPLKHISVIVETADCNPVIVSADASPDMCEGCGGLRRTSKGNQILFRTK